MSDGDSRTTAAYRVSGATTPSHINARPASRTPGGTSGAGNSSAAIVLKSLSPLQGQVAYFLNVAVGPPGERPINLRRERKVRCWPNAARRRMPQRPLCGEGSPTSIRLAQQL